MVATDISLKGIPLLSHLMGGVNVRLSLQVLKFAAKLLVASQPRRIELRRRDRTARLALMGAIAKAAVCG
jgi:hypothetical protein